LRSVASHHDDLLLFMQQSKLRRYDILALTETWIPEENVRLYPITGYKPFIQPRTDGRRSGGVMLYIRENLKIIECREIKISTANILHLRLRIDSNTVPQYVSIDDAVSLLVVYRDWKWPVPKFLGDLESLLESFEHNKNALLIGDINIDILDIKESSSYLNLMSSHGFDSIQNLPTRGDSCLDHVFVRKDQLKICAKLLETKITDHSTISIDITSESLYGNNSEVKEVKILNEKKFVENLRRVDWSWVDEIEKKKIETEILK